VNDDDVRRQLLAIIRSIAPEIDESELVSGQPLREQMELDSMDWLKVVLGVHEKMHVDIPEAHYGKLRTLDDWVAYLRPKLAA